MSNSFAQIVFDIPVDGPFDYAVPEDLRGRIFVGSRVMVIFNGRRQIGFVVGLRDHADVKKVLPVLSLPDEGPIFDAKHLEWMLWLSRHYGCSWGQALGMSVPASLRRSSKIRVPKNLNAPSVPLFRKEGEEEPTLSSPSLRKRGLGGVQPLLSLIHDPSQKHQWPLIESRIKETWERGQSILILVPEISAFKQWREFLKVYRKDVFVVDPVLKDKERTTQWLAIRQSSQSIVFGTRSAVFAPVENLGLILMIDEDHDFFKEEQSPFQHVREVVLEKAKRVSCAVIFVSRVPSPELWEMSVREGWDVKSFAVEASSWFQKIDVTNFTQMDAVTLTPPLIKRIEEALGAKQKIVLYWNRRGFHRVTSCLKCGENIRCPRCDVNLVYSLERKTLFCGRCGFAEVFGGACPKCRSPLLKSFGRGGEKFAKDLKKFFPSASIARHDSQDGDLPDVDITIATQSVLARPTAQPYGLIAVLDFDSEISHPDFRAGHKAFRLLIRLRLIAENMVIQTRNASNPIVLAVERLDFPAFYQYDLGVRRELKFPPFGHLLEVVVRGLKQEAVEIGAQAVYELLKAKVKDPDAVSDPQPDSRPKLRDKYRYRMILKCSDAEAMVADVKEALKGFRKGGLVTTINLDP